MEVGAGIWLFLAIAIGVLASREFGRSGVGWFLLALILSPLAGLLLFILPVRRRPCPFCAEPIHGAAIVCRFCGREVPGTGERFGLPKATRVLLLVVMVAVLVTALSQCQYRFKWWRGEPPMQVQGGIVDMQGS